MAESELNALPPEPSAPEAKPSTKPGAEKGFVQRR
jgi:hypothetical protein